jgi:WD40 repeat protein
MLQKNLCLLAAMPFAFFSMFCGNKTATSQKRVPLNDSAIHATGAIAFIRGISEIRLIDSNGKNERLIWTHPDAKLLGLHDVAWRPDGKELAFSSSHEALFSLYDADLYAIRPDGSGLRKITNAPSHEDFDKYKKGSVTLTVRNNQYSFQAAQSSAGVFIVNILGADAPQQITVPPGSSKTIVFKSVADFGKRAQQIVATFGRFRWFMPGTDVEAGKTIKAPDLIISGDGIEMFGAYRPVWKQDGTEISYRTGTCMVEKISVQSDDFNYHPLFEKVPAGACNWDWGPTAALRDMILYTENSGDGGSGIFLMKEGGLHDPATRQTLFSDNQYQQLNDLQWLPDGSGFVYSTINLFFDAANIFLFDMKTKQTRQLTQIKSAFARKLCISPSGRWIVYERGKTADDDADVDLWIIGTDGRGDHLLVKNGLSPSWSK